MNQTTVGSQLMNAHHILYGDEFTNIDGCIVRQLHVIAGIQIDDQYVSSCKEWIFNTIFEEKKFYTENVHFILPNLVRTSCIVLQYVLLPEPGGPITI